MKAEQIAVLVDKGISICAAIVALLSVLEIRLRLSIYR